MPRRILSIIKSRRGISIMFVLGIMFLLLIIGTSIMAAASATVGAGMRQNEYNRAITLSNSVHRSILHGLSVDVEDEDYYENENSLTGQIANKILDAHENGEEIEISLTATITTTDAPITMLDEADESIDIRFPHLGISSTGPRGYIPPIFSEEEPIVELVPEVERVPYTATISSRMSVTVVVEAKGIFTNNRPIVTTALYEFETMLSDEPNAPAYDQSDTIHELTASDLGDGSYYKWTLLEYTVGE